MTDDRQAADLAAIKAREENVRSAIRRGEPSVDTGPFGMDQLGLHAVVADRWGRMWRVDGTALTLISGPRRAGR